MAANQGDSPSSQHENQRRSQRSKCRACYGVLIHSLKRSEGNLGPLCAGLSRSAPDLAFVELRGGSVQGNVPSSSSSSTTTTTPSPSAHSSPPPPPARDFRYTCLGSSLYKVPPRNTTAGGPRPGDEDFPLCRGIEVLVEKTRASQKQKEQQRKQQQQPNNTQTHPTPSAHHDQGIIHQTLPNLTEAASRAMGGSDFPQRFQKSAMRISSHCVRNWVAINHAMLEVLRGGRDK